MLRLKDVIKNKKSNVSQKKQLIFIFLSEFIFNNFFYSNYFIQIMKKILFGIFALSLLVISTANAQLEKGRMYLGANVGFTSGTTKQTLGNNSTSSTTSTFTLLPSFGYFIGDNMSLGLGIGFSQDKSKPNTNTTNTSNQFIVAPHFRYYVPTSSEQFAFFVQAELSIGSGSNKNEVVSGPVTTTTENNLNSVSFFVSPNFAFFPTKSWAIELGFQGIGYRSTTTKVKNSNPENKVTDSAFVFDVNSFAPNFAVRYFF